MWNPEALEARTAVWLSRSRKGRTLLKSSNHSPCGDRGTRRENPSISLCQLLGKGTYLIM
jgi:hypothetical protein